MTEEAKTKARPIATRWRREAWTIAICGVLLRGLLVILAGRPELVADESNYLYSALYWNYFGHYADSYRYLWPPGYPFWLAQLLRTFGSHAIEIQHWIQVGASLSTGYFTMRIAHRLFGQRAMRMAGWIWCLYLPLAEYTLHLWSEALFVPILAPALYFGLGLFLEGGELAGWRVVCAGLLFALSAYIKEIGAIFALALIPALLLGASGLEWSERLRRASLFALSMVACLLPWSLRNERVYARLVPVAATLGENCYNGVNQRYVNFDLTGLRGREGQSAEPPIPRRMRAITTQIPEAAPGWSRPHAILNTIDRQAEERRRALAWVREHPPAFLRTRVQKLADLLAPHSFLSRHLAMGLYDQSPLGSPSLRRWVLIWTMLCPLLLIPLALSALGSLPPTARALVWTMLALVAASSTIVAMSRFRLPALPLLFALAGGALDRGGSIRRLSLVTFLLAPLWWLSYPGVAAVFELAWSTS